MQLIPTMNRIFAYRLATTSILSVVTLLLSSNAFATGLYIPLQSTSEQGNARAGGAAVAEDASTIYFNAASISRVTRIKGNQLSFSLSGANSNYRFWGTMRNGGFLNLSPIFQSGTVSYRPGGVFPSIYFVRKITKCLSFGMTTTTIYGLGLHFPTNSLVRYAIIHSNQRSTGFGPTLSYQFTPKLAVGAGVDLLRYILKRKQAVRTQPLTGLDSYITTNLDTWNLGWHAGLLYEFCPTTRIGLSYRSQFVVHLDGNSNSYTLGRSPLRVVPIQVPRVNRNTHTAARVPLASLTILSFYHEVCAWAFMASIEYMNWSTYKYDHAYRVASPIGGTQDTVNVRNLHDTIRYAVGFNYQLNKKLLLRAGMGLNPGATGDARRQVTLPDLTNVGISIGANYNVSRALSFDFAYGHTFEATGSVNDINPNTNNIIIGHTIGSTNVGSFQINYSFG